MVGWRAVTGKAKSFEVTIVEKSVRRKLQEYGAGEEDRRRMASFPEDNHCVLTFLLLTMMMRDKSGAARLTSHLCLQHAIFAL